MSQPSLRHGMITVICACKINGLKKEKGWEHELRKKYYGKCLECGWPRQITFESFDSDADDATYE